jgi:hypothetical protein
MDILDCPAYQLRSRLHRRPALYIISRHIDGLEPTLARHGYHLRNLVEQFDGKVHEFKALLNNTLDPERTAERREKMLAAGLPLR